MADEARPRLGRGLAALLGDSAEELVAPANRSSGQRMAPIERLRPNPHNPRKHFEEEALDELAQSIRERGLLQPIVVRAAPGHPDFYEIVAGERRWRAAQRAGVHEVPVVRIEATDKQALEIAIVENVQRTDLSVLEESEGYRRLIDEFEYSHQDLGKAIGKSRSYVSNALRLLKLPDEARELLAKGEISAGHARALLNLSDPNAVAREIVRSGLSVRDVEKMSESAARRPSEKRDLRERTQDPVTAQVEKQLADALGMAVALKCKGETGEVRIRFETLDQLELLCGKLQG